MTITHGTQAQRDARHIIDQATWSAQDCKAGSIADHIPPAFEIWAGHLDQLLPHPDNGARFSECYRELSRLGFNF